MKNKQILLFAFVFSVVIGLSGFALHQNKNRKIKTVEIEFSATEPVFLTDSLVNKLLILKKGYKPDQLKDSLDLSMLESLIEKNPAVAVTEAFTYPDGRLGMRIEERKPFLHIKGEHSFFLDQQGNRFQMPSVVIDSLPSVRGKFEDSELPMLLKLVKTLQQDLFLRQNQIEIIKTKTGLDLNFSGLPYTVSLGQPVKLKEKINKLKAYQAYQNAQEERSLAGRINLAFEGQVVTTKQ